ncbi:DUF2793 domain-containing protein [Rhodoplanes azumiensis]|uniref:DUF2793 domain-containing protein n=1 Tax=Rhodoplanes azumiensis TaxID=1897628 RepID=A0ABW5AES6_9BRAD
MTDTLHLGLPLIAAAQAQKHVTHNEALHRLDALVMLAVVDRDLVAPPASPADGDRYLVKATGSGAFAGHDDAIAHYVDGGWEFHVPAAGWLCWVADESVLVAWTGDAWRAVVSGEAGGGGGGGDIDALQNLALLGVGTTADATNPLAAKLNNALWVAKSSAEGGSGDLRYKLSKESTAKTLSLLFQTAYSGRAEIGLAGDDDLRIKVSADGTTWLDALVVDRTTGAVALPNTRPTSFRNRIVNGNFAVNQRSVSGTVTLAANAYGHDRWKAGAGGCSYTFATSGLDTTITVTSGTLCQVIEGTVVEGGVHVASWSGTAQARVYQGAAAGAYAASGFVTASLSAATNTTIEFGTGTLTRVQLEPGVTATAFERRDDELRRCQRYYEKGVFSIAPGNSGTGGVWFSFLFAARKRAAPTMALSNASGGGFSSPFVSPNATDGFQIGYTATAASSYFTADWTATAEL